MSDSWSRFVTWHCSERAWRNGWNLNPSTATGGAACAPSGSGDILDTVDLPAGSSVTYSATGTSATFLGNAASVSVPAGVTDPDPSNDSTGDAPSGGGG